jgi:tetratricopeptide (TPR) repeat protein
VLIELLVDLASGRVRAQASTDLASAVPRALDALDWLIESFPGTDYAEQAYLRKGDLILRVQKDPKKALEVYKRGMSTARFYRTMFAERLGRVYLIIEDYEEAQKHFEQLVKSNNEELRDTGIFYGALMLTFVREYESARDTLTSLAEQNPSSQFANDALELAWVIEEGLQGDQRVLNSYTRALQSELADDSTRVIAELRRVSASTVDTPLRRRGLIRLGEFYQAQGKYDAALESYQTFVRDYPEDGQIAEAHRKIGQLYEKGYRNMELALETYESILITHPYYIFLDEVRDDVTRIRTLIEEN